MIARIAVLASGTGSNLEAILNHFNMATTAPTAAVVLVASDNPAAGALARGAAHHVEHVVLPDWADGPALVALLARHRVDTIALAGYLRHVPHAVTDAFRGHIVNVHPSLLPAFGGAGMYGRRVHQAAIAAGVRVSGATVHFVDDQYDHGPIIAQVPVPVFPSDDAAALASRVLQAEHVLYPRALEAVVTQRVTLGVDGRVAGAV